jgi:hypothetical protein
MDWLLTATLWWLTFLRTPAPTCPPPETICYESGICVTIQYSCETPPSPSR